MALKNGSSFWQAMHFLVRFLGLNGLVALAVAAFLWQVLAMEQVALIVGAAGAVAVALAFLGEMRGLTQATFSHRGAAGINVLLQITMATALVVGGNVFSFLHYKRFDLTTDQVFALDDSIRQKLANLRGDTDIIVYLQHVSFGQRIELRQDEYDQAAEKKIIEKVIDLAEQFQELGPRFRVQVLDSQKKNFNERKNAIKKLSEELADAIEKAPENSIFFFSPETRQIQRLGFNDIYQLDRKASAEANNGRGNLVLNYQGVQTFADKVFKIEEKKPRIGFAVVHGFLGQEGTEDIGMPGLKEALIKRGYEGRDIVLRKWPQRDPAALEYEESRFELLESRRNNLEKDIKGWVEEMVDDKRERDFWNNSKFEEIAKDRVLVLTAFGPQVRKRTEIEEYRKATGKVPAFREITEEMRVSIAKQLTEDYESYEQELVTKRKKLAKTIEEQSKLRVDNLAEQRRISDVREKMKRLLADIDMLVVPRATYFNLLRGDPARGGDHISPRVYSLEDSQLLAIKDFMKAGKPVLFCLGPANEAFGGPAERGSDDSLEKLLAELNVELPNQMILFNVEAEAMAEQDELQAGRVEVPSAEFDWRLPVGSRMFGSFDAKAAPPIRNSMLMTVHGLGEKSRDALKFKQARPVYVARTTWKPEVFAQSMLALAVPWPAGPYQALAALHGSAEKKIDETAVILMSPAEAWNEAKPFPSERYVPRFKRPSSDDPTKGTLLEKRRGPFPIGIAMETEVPMAWYENDTPTKPVKARLAVFGHGGIFIGDRLPPLREKLFLDVSNWLLGRDNLLARDNQTWQYPRVEVSSFMKPVWEWGVARALPFAFLYLGVVVWLVRRMR